ncbi:hypothetical protein DFP94_1011136 [Fontibacillus phaseoli]|uniref:Uncharacterized protein n=1 Tax=Fontibacillus phaseoli TaxID=1416533 RepID=A0A369BSZ1_9BACL|nr:hypothetical protein [Fontibacillus phaseoli]RCX23537.1 hypothetical protein DFP94_1011136 [Fontibacillus phaseoli]
MSNALSKITAALLAVILLYLFPAFQYAEREEDLRLLAAYNCLVQFTDAIRIKGYLSPVMYEDFSRELESTGAIYDIELEHRHKKYHPEYEDPADPATFKEDFSVVYDSYFTSAFLEEMYPSSLPVGDSTLRKYKLEAGDFVNVTLVKRSHTAFDALSGFISGFLPGNGHTQALVYGGMVLNEDY